MTQILFFCFALFLPLSYFFHPLAFFGAIGVVFYGIKWYNEVTFVEVEENIFIESKYAYLTDQVKAELQRLRNNCASYGYSELHTYPVKVYFHVGIIPFYTRKLSGYVDGRGFKEVKVHIALFNSKLEPDKNMPLSKSAMVHEFAHVIIGRRLQKWDDKIHHQIMSDQGLDK